MSISFAKTERQKNLLEQVTRQTKQFVASDSLFEGAASFPFANIEALKEIGYTASALPKELGGENLSLYDFLLIQEQIAEADGRHLQRWPRLLITF